MSSLRGRNLQAECDSYEAKIAHFGGIELFLGGIGPDGHIAFSESVDGKGASGPICLALVGIRCYAN